MPPLFLNFFFLLLYFCRATPAFNLTALDWEALNKTVNGRLFRAYPLAKPCFGSYAGQEIDVDDGACSVIRANWTLSRFQTDNFGGYDWSNYGACMSTHHSCTLKYALPSTALPTSQDCHQGSVPDYYIRVSSHSDVLAALNFARQTRVPLVVKNSGHDHKGRSSAPKALALWMHTLQPPLRLVRGFVPEGCEEPVGDGVTMGGGQEFAPLYIFADANNVTVVTGSSATVRPAGGWMTGGGHSPISNKFGLGVDNVLQLKTVLPDGRFVTANRCQNQEVFWALRGGGGNAFGVNMEMTVKAWPMQGFQGLSFSVTATDRDAFKKVLAVVVESSVKWAEEGWGGVISTGLASPLNVGISMLNGKLDNAVAKDSMVGLLKLVNSTLVTRRGRGSIKEYRSYLTAYKSVIGGGGYQGLGVAVSSRLIPSSAMKTQEKRDRMTDALAEISNIIVPSGASNNTANAISLAGQIPVELLMTTPYNYKQSTDSNDQTSVTPAWRNSVWHVVLKEGFQNGIPLERVNSAFQKVHDAANILRKLVPDTGAYQNEADIFEPKAAKTFWGRENYDRLLKLKKKLDPDNIFTCWGCIGWDPNDERFGCYPDIGVKSAVVDGYQ